MKIKIFVLTTIVLVSLVLLGGFYSNLEAGNKDTAAKIFRESAENILKCLHPTGKYGYVKVDSTKYTGDYYYVEGYIKWYGGFLGTTYYTTVGMYIRDDEAKIEIVKDDAIIPGGEHCDLFSWTRLSAFGESARNAGRNLFRDTAITAVVVASELEKDKKRKKEEFCKSVKWPNSEGDCAIAAFKTTEFSPYGGNTHCTIRAKGYINRVFSNGNYEFKITTLYTAGQNVEGFRKGGTVSRSLLYPCVTQEEICKIWKECLQ